MSAAKMPEHRPGIDLPGHHEIPAEWIPDLVRDAQVRLPEFELTRRPPATVTYVRRAIGNMLTFHYLVLDGAQYTCDDYAGAVDDFVGLIRDAFALACKEAGALDHTK